MLLEEVGEEGVVVRDNQRDLVLPPPDVRGQGQEEHNQIKRGHAECWLRLPAS